MDGPASSQPSYLQNVHEVQPRPHLRIHAINIFVHDQDESVRFYVDVLGFNLVADMRLGTADRWVAVAPPDGSTVLSLIAPAPDSKAFALVGKSTQVVFVTEDVVGLYHEWRKRGVAFQHTPRLKRVKYRPKGAATEQPISTDEGPVWGGVFTRFKDPDGNTFALLSFDEESRAVEAQRRAIAAKLEAERRAGQELEIARQVQTRLFPQTSPELATLDYSGACIQARQVGGDYYDFLQLGQGRLGFLVSDISGKGIAAALLMANLQANLRSQCAIAFDQPQRFLQMINRVFYENSTESSYATLFFAAYDDQLQRLCYVNCGHLAALLLHSDGTLEQLHSTSTVVGLFENWECSVEQRLLRCGDILALYTDGLTESTNEAGVEFGEGRLIESLRQHRELCAQRVVALTLSDVKRFSPEEQQDDQTLIVAKCRNNR